MVERIPQSAACRPRTTSPACRFVVGTLTLFLVASGSCVASPRSQDAIWLISTRGLNSLRCSCAVEPNLRVWQLQDGCHWQRSSEEAFYATDDSDVITTVYVHGNRLDPNEAVTQGLAMYRLVASHAEPGVSIRHIIWSWPSDKVVGPLRDARIKAQRTDSESYYLAHLLTGVSPDVRVSLIGYSFGARVVMGSLHVLGGGSIRGTVLAAPRSTPVRSVLLAPALDNTALLPGRVYGHAAALVDRMAITYNPCDRLLKLYPLVFKDQRRAALGYTGLVCPDRLGETVDRIDQINSTPWVGKSHDFATHMRSLGVRDTVSRYSLWN